MKKSPVKLNLPADYKAFVSDLKAKIQTAQVQACLAVTRELTVLYWEIGTMLLEKQHRDLWGEKILEQMSHDLKIAFPRVKGFSLTNLKYMRSFAQAYPDKEFVETTVSKIPWGQNISIVQKTSNVDQRKWYIQKTFENGWSRPVLIHQIDSKLYERQGLKEKTTNFSKTLPKAQSDLANEIIKDPYNLDFLTLTESATERDLENGLIEHLQKFLVELGKGFAFVGNQYHLEIGQKDYFLDLLFYHLELRCFVVIEIKMRDFEPEFAGKLNFYLSAVDDLLTKPQDNPSIGIILCRGKDHRVTLEYALKDINKPIGVTGYEITEALPENLKSSLPTVEEIEAELGSSETKNGEED